MRDTVTSSTVSIMRTVERLAYTDGEGLAGTNWSTTYSKSFGPLRYNSV